MALLSSLGALKFFNYIQRARPSLSYLCTNGRDRQCFVQRSWILACNMYSRDADAENTADGMGPGLNAKKKKVFVPRVTLLSEDNEMSIVTMEMAEKLAKRRNLKLVKIVDFDTKTERPTYKLMSTKNYLQEGFESKKEKKLNQKTVLKPEKLVFISSNISEHDLIIKINSVSKLLAKKHEIRIFICGNNNTEKATAVVNQIEKSVKELSVDVKTSSSKGNFKVYLRPIIEAEIRNSRNNKTKDNEVETPTATAS